MSASSVSINPGLTGALMVCGNTSDSGKTTIVAGLCRLLARNGVRVAPFKAQNMSLNSAVTASGHEIGRAQYLQAQAAGVEPEVAMNPILLKPTSDVASQVVVMGQPVERMTAAEYHEAKPRLLGLVLDTLSELRSRFDVVLLEGAGSPAEINLLPNDIVNLRVAKEAGLGAIIVGDIDPGGVFASLYGTVAVLPPDLQALVAGFIINKLRGDPDLLLDGTDQLRSLIGLPTFGVVPMIEDLHLDAEDSMALTTAPEASPNASLDVAILQLPQLSNFTDFDPLHLEPDVGVRYVRSARELGRPDLVIIPGSKATVADLAWLRSRGLDVALESLIEAGRCTVLGICAGYQMLGRQIHDLVESESGSVDGLGLLPVTTDFAAEKVLASVQGTALGEEVAGYQIHHGRISSGPDGGSGAVFGPDVETWLRLGETAEGVRAGAVYGTTVHGLFEQDAFRRRFLAVVAARADAGYQPGGPSPAQHRDDELDRLADVLAETLDLGALQNVIAAAGDVRGQQRR